MESRYLPMSAHNIHLEFESLREYVQNGQQGLNEGIDQLLRLIEAFIPEKDALKEACERITAALSSQNAALSAMDKKIESICSAMFGKEYPVDVQFEREYYRDFPVGVTPEFPDFQKQLLALLQGLDAKSVETVILGIQRLKIIKETQEPILALYSQEEKDTMRYILEHFVSCVLPLSESCFYCQGYLLPINHFEACVFWDKCGISYLDYPDRLSSGDIIDAGAFIGDSALVLSPLTQGNIHAFEPTPKNYQYLLQTIQLNQLTNVVPIQAALGAQSGTVTISVSDSCSTQFENKAIPYQDTTSAKVITLDEYVRQHGLTISLIKADVEGAEQLLLQGALETIKAQKPTLIISIYHNANDFFHIKPMLEQLDLGYQFKIRHPVGGSILTETILIAEVP